VNQVQDILLTYIATISQSLQAFKDRYFPERQLFLRSEGRVSFVKFSSRLQIISASCFVVFLGWVGISTVTYLTRDIVLESKINQIADLRSDYQKLDEDYNALDSDVRLRTDKLQERQRYLESILNDSDVKNSETISDTPSDDVAKKTPVTLLKKNKNQAMLIERLLGSGTAYADADMSRTSMRKSALLLLREIDLKQQEIASKILARSQTKLAEIDSILKNTPVSIERLVKQFEGDTNGMGGPYIPEQGFSPLFTANDNSIYQSLQNDVLRLDIATSALDSFPTGEPAAKYYVSSRYGNRIDPFTKRKSRHYGLDMAGWPGTAIQATAEGTVIKAGLSGPYGRMVEIDHGNGFHTRYGHMNKLNVKVGQLVLNGQKIGDMGKTGRATSSHLHYEIWFEGKVEDPLPFIKAAQDVRKIQGRYESS
jgi:murein DD-endopeptidase MepM/ murein hydrolase activator NlpD